MEVLNGEQNTRLLTLLELVRSQPQLQVVRDSVYRRAFALGDIIHARFKVEGVTNGKAGLQRGFSHLLREMESYLEPPVRIPHWNTVGRAFTQHFVNQFDT